MKSLRALILLATLCWLLPATTAHAIYGPAAGGFGADIVSVENASDEQANAPTVDGAISADGRYVVFQTRTTNLFEDDGGIAGPHGTEPDAEPPGTLREGGIFRYDRVTGAIQLVADGTETHTEGPEKGKLVFGGAQNPSVSADGRYVAFSTAQQLVAQDKNENVDVYVRDMDLPLTADRAQSGAYTLVSARSGGEEPATYAPREPPLKGAEPGSDVWQNTSISADGRYVVFRTTESDSDLPDHAAVDTPPGQLFVRDLQTHTTTLITRKTTSTTYASGDPAFSSEGPRIGPAAGPAAISADGSTVSWVSSDAPEQTRFLRGETTSAAEPYYLWRRWQEGGPTRRITGIADPDDPACNEEQEAVSPADKTATGPCYGPLNEPESGLASISSTAPALSADGYTVAFLAGAALRPNFTKSSGLDVFLTSMRPGVTRKAGTRELTLGVNSGNVGSTPSIESLAMSPDGSTLAFTTSRTDFVLPEPKPVGTFRPNPTADDLYVIDLGQNTIERAVVSYEGKDPNGSVQPGPTLTQDGSTVAFVSYASNLIYGDANEAPDVFTATLKPPAGTAAPSSEVNSTATGFSLSAAQEPELGLNVKRGRAGGLILLVETPAAGRLTARARGALSWSAARVTPKTHGRKSAHGRPASTLLAHASAVALSEGTTTIALHLSSRYAAYLQRHGKLKAAITVEFSPSGAGERLTAGASAAFTAATGSPKARHRPSHARKR